MNNNYYCNMHNYNYNFFILTLDEVVEVGHMVCTSSQVLAILAVMAEGSMIAPASQSYMSQAEQIPAWKGKKKKKRWNAKLVHALEIQSLAIYYHLSPENTLDKFLYVLVNC